MADHSRALAAVLFDLDGTLVDSDAVVARTWARWARRRGVDLAEVMRVTPGRPARDAIPELAPWLSAEEQAADVTAHLDLEVKDLDGVVPTPGALGLLSTLDGWGVPWAVVTSCSRPLALARMGAAGIPIPEILMTSSEIERGKPDPEGYLAASARLGVRAPTTLVVEDAPAGVLAGRAAGSVVAGLGVVAGAHFNVPHLPALRARLAPDGEGRLVLADVV